MKFRHILAAFATLILAAGCQSTDEAKLLEDPDTVTVIASSGNKFDGRGGNLDILLKSNVNYQVKTDVDWITRNVSRSAAVNGVESFTVAPYPLALDRTPRKGTVTVSYTGLETITYTVEQTPGDVYRFLVKTMTTKDVAAKGGDITFTLDTNIDYTAELSASDWITVTKKEPSSLTITIAENTDAEPRTGSVTFKTDVFEPKVVEFNQNGKSADAGIGTADQLIAFAQAVNSGASLDQWLNDEEEIVLTADIDLAGRTWTPIGKYSGATITNGSVSGGSGTPFTGVFNGQGYTIKNLSMTTDNDQFFGLFGFCSGATIKNLKLDSSCSMTITNEAMTYGITCGFIAACIDRCTIENVTVSAILKESIFNKTSTKYFGCIAGIVGYASSSTISKCRFDGEMKRVRSNVYDNSYGSAVAGIVANSRGSASLPTTIDGCVNAGTIYAECNRVAGILACSPSNYIIRNCENSGVVHANVVQATAAGWASGLRVGGILGFTSNTNVANVALVENCTNSGTVVCEADAKTYVGGVVGHIRCITLKNLKNTGTVIGTAGAVGLVLGQLQCADSPTVGDCYVGGRIATAFTGEGKTIQPTNPTAASADNYLEKGVGAITGTNSGHWSATNVHLLAQ